MSRGTLDTALLLSISDTRLSRFLAGLPRPFSYQLQINYAVLTPKDKSSGLGSFPFARRYSGNRCFFLFLRVLRCFSSPGCPPRPYVFGVGICTLLCMGSPIRRPPGRRMCAPRRGLSQLAASFIGSLCQGIRRAPVVSCGTASGPRDIHVSLIKLINRYHE